MKYHIDKNGKAAVCKATKRQCPLGGADVHFDTLEEAEAYSQNKMEQEFGLMGVSKPPVVGESDVVEKLYGDQLREVNFANVVDQMKNNHPEDYKNFVENLQLGDKKFTQTELIQTFHDYLETYPNDNISVYENLEVLSDEYNPSEGLKSFYVKNNTDENKDHVASEIAAKFKNDTYAENSLRAIVIDDEKRSNLQNMTDVENSMIYASPAYAYKLNVDTNEVEQFNIHTLFASNLNERDTALYVLDEHPDYDFYEPDYFIALAKTNKSVAEYVLKLDKESK